MKHAILLLFAGGLLAGLTGCVFPHGRAGTGLMHGSCQNAPENCAACDGQCDDDCNCNDPNCRCHHCLARHHANRAGAQDAGPPAPTVVYPYYTVRGPRDFLARNPGSIGP